MNNPPLNVATDVFDDSAPIQREALANDVFANTNKSTNRGIVAAGIASLFGLKLASDGVEGAEYAGAE